MDRPGLVAERLSIDGQNRTLHALRSIRRRMTPVGPKPRLLLELLCAMLPLPLTHLLTYP